MDMKKVSLATIMKIILATLNQFLIPALQWCSMLLEVGKIINKVATRFLMLMRIVQLKEKEEEVRLLKAVRDLRQQCDMFLMNDD